MYDLTSSFLYKEKYKEMGCKLPYFFISGN